MKKPYLCIYHGNCADGFTAAWVVRCALGEENVEFHPGVYGETFDIERARDKEVFFVDFSYSYDVLYSMALIAKSVLVIDHHKTTIDELTGKVSALPLHADYGNWPSLEETAALQNGVPLHSYFSLDHSGAMLAWKYFHGTLPAPFLVRHVEDRDLWRFKLPGTKEIQAAVFSYEYTFENWDMLDASFDYLGDSSLRQEGTAIQRKHMKDVRELIAIGEHRMFIGGYVVPVLNAPYFHSSEAGHIMAKGERFAACYYFAGGEWRFSLRSTDEGMDVGQIAKLYGGGGHRNAAGFAVQSLDEFAYPQAPQQDPTFLGEPVLPK